jgi:hypothetical protein
MALHGVERRRAWPTTFACRRSASTSPFRGVDGLPKRRRPDRRGRRALLIPGMSNIAEGGPLGSGHFPEDSVIGARAIEAGPGRLVRFGSFTHSLQRIWSRNPRS